METSEKQKLFAEIKEEINIKFEELEGLFKQLDKNIPIISSEVNQLKSELEARMMQKV